jgi:exosortase/archaeosortase family protein
MIQPKKVILAVTPLGLPILCTGLIHHFFYLTFGENNLTLGIYSRDIYIPLGIGAVFSLYQMVGKGVSVRLRPRIFAGFLSLGLGIILFLKNYFFLITKFSHSFLVATLLSSCVLLLCLAFLSTLKFSEVLSFVRKKNSAATYLLIATISLLNYPLILKFFWREASYLTARSVYYIYKIFGLDLHFRLTPVSFNLTGGGFAIKIIMGCSGLEGIFFFIFGFSLIQCLEKRGFDWKVGLAYGVGSLFLFLLNTFRISLFYFLGIQFEKLYSGRIGKEMIEAAFHNHLGWILYLLGIIIFIRTYRKMENRLLRATVA